MPISNVVDAVMQHVAAQPEVPALIEGSYTLTYGELGVMIRRTVTFLRRAGIVPGGRVGIAMANGIDNAVLLLALLRIGAVPVKLPAETGVTPILVTANKYSVRIVISDPDLDLAEAPGMVQIRIGITWRDELLDLPEDTVSASGLDDLSVLELTGGSTGIPVGVVTTHRQLLRRREVWIQAMQPFSQDLDGPPLVLLAAPARYSYFFTGLVVYLCSGGTLVLMPEYARGIDLLRAVASYRGAFCFATANICRFFLAASSAGKLLLPHLRVLEWSGQPLSAEEKRALLTQVTPNLAENYGAAGAGRISDIQREEFVRKPGTVGRPVPGMEIEIVDDAGIPVSPGAFGRLRCRAESMAKGPCPEDAATAGPEYFRDGWYYPGDLCSQDEDGYLILKGRGADVMRRRGVEIFAGDIESALRAHPSVRDAAVIGRASATIGEEIIAFVVPRGAPRHEDLAQHCRAVLTSERWPDHVFYIDALPQNAAGKLERLQLRALADARLRVP
jgi:acyl-coenzyme A synthetase/AMP-(fatty) acid ligase